MKFRSTFHGNKEILFLVSRSQVKHSKDGEDCFYVVVGVAY